MNLKFVTRRATRPTLFVAAGDTGLSDSLFDGDDVPAAVVARNWVLEHAVHQTVLLSSALSSTRSFLGQQKLMVRDDVRLTTIAAVQEGDRLVLVTIANGQQVRSVFQRQGVWRSHIELDKFSGEPIIAWVRDGAERQLFLSERRVETEAADLDFPTFALSQAPIGHVQASPAPYGVLAYKSRKTGQLLARRVVGAEHGPEIALAAPLFLGGAGLAISARTVLIRIDAIEGGRITPMISRSVDEGRTFGAFEPVPLPYGDDYRVIPAHAGPIVDYGGFFHLPVGVTNGVESIALDVLVDEAAVEAIKVSGPLDPRSGVAAAAFPRKPGLEAMIPRFGNGTTDGLGVISILVTEGRLYTSNSQAGGIHYPEPVHLNYDMPQIAAVAYTECYTSGLKPNIVSMDYAYLEAGLDGAPLSGALHFETWDMPLPEPVLTAVAKGTDIEVKIEQDANFEPGRTVFDFDDPAVAIASVEITGDRSALIKTEGVDSLVGKRLSFEMRSRFYHHAGASIIR